MADNPSVGECVHERVNVNWFNIGFHNSILLFFSAALLSTCVFLKIYIREREQERERDGGCQGLLEFNSVLLFFLKKI